MLRDKAGNRLFRRIEVKVIFPDKIFPVRTYVQKAGPHQGFGPEGVDAMLMDIADKLEELYPWWNFTVVELSPVGRTARFVFTFAGTREVSATDTTNTQNNKNDALEPEMAGEILMPSLFQEPVKIGEVK